MSLRSLRRFNCADVAPRSASGHLLRAAQIIIESWQRHYNTAARLTRIQAASTGGVHACIRRVAGCATPTGSAGHAGATANLKLTFHLDHSAGADHSANLRAAGLAFLAASVLVDVRALLALSPGVLLIIWNFRI